MGMRFEGKVAIVTGGGSGIGAAIAERFHAEGASVVIAGRDSARLEAQLARMDGASVIAVPTDVSVPAELERLVGETVATFGRLDILVNNAGSGTLGRIDEIEPFGMASGDRNRSRFGVLCRALCRAPAGRDGRVDRQHLLDLRRGRRCRVFGL